MLDNQGKKSQIKRQSKFGSLAQLVSKVYVGATLLVMGLALLGYFMVGGLVTDAARQQGAEAHKQLLQQLQQRLDDYIRPVEMLAADPQLNELIAMPDLIRLRQQELAGVIGAQSITLIPAGLEKEQLGEFPLLSYAELDLIHAAQNGQSPGIEFHELNQGQSHIDVVRPVIRQDALVGKTIVGYLLVRYDSVAFLEQLQGLFSSSDHVELSQVLSDGSTQLFKGWGDAALKGPSQEHSGAINDSRWQLSYWQTPYDWQIQGMSWRVFYWILSAGVLVVLALALMVLWWLLDSKTKASANKIYEYVWDRINGHWMGKGYVAELSEMQPTLIRLQNLSWSVASPEKEAVISGHPADAFDADVIFSRDEDEVVVDAPLADTFYVDLLYQDSAVVDVEEIAAPVLEKRSANPDVPASIFRAYDIRGIVGQTLTADIVYDIGRAFSSEAKEKGAQTIVVGRDGRGSSKALANALIQGLCDSGRDVINIGQVPTPVLYFATHYLSARSGIMVTGSHNPPDYNGLKLVLQGETLAEAAIQQLYQRIVVGDYCTATAQGNVTQQLLTADYMARIAGDVNLLRELKVVVDGGNGVAGEVAPQLLRVLGCEVIELHCDVDGTFPNHHPDPSQPENLSDLIAAVKSHGADIGIAFDGDGDRLGVVDSRGNIFWPDRLIMLLAIDMLKEHPGGTIIYDVKSTRDLRRVIEQHGGQSLMWKSGHSLLKAKLKETGALMAGELSGHLYLNDRWYGFDDALYAAARLLEIIARGNLSSADLFKQLPEAISTPELRASLAEGASFKVIERLKAQTSFPTAQLIILDGIRAEFDDGWGLVRASNTTPCLTFRFEAETHEALQRIQKIFRDAVLALEPGLKLPF